MEPTIVELGQPTGADFEGFVEVCGSVDHELTPDDPIITASEIEGYYFRQRQREESRTWLARIDGDPVGAMAIEIPHDANEAELRPEIWVLPEVRRQGVAAALLRSGLTATAAGRSRLAAWVETDAARGMCRWLGLDHRQQERCSRLAVSDLDREQQRRWIDEAPAAAAGYQLVFWQGRCPDEHLDAFCTAYDGMADIPVDDLDHDHSPVTAHDVRDAERALGDVKIPVVALALSPDGDAAGLSVLWANQGRRHLAHQDDTAVMPDHRGRAIGRWLKAANLEQALALQPDITTVETYNAESNPWMLAINVDMGFRPFKGFDAFQGPIDHALRVLGD